MSKFIHAALLTLPLAACGGGGGSGVASTPVPGSAPAPAPAPAPSVVSTSVKVTTVPTPATSAGTYDAIALVTLDADGNSSATRLAAPKEIRITTYQEGPFSYEKQYTIEFATNVLPLGQSSLTARIPGISLDVRPDGGFSSGTIYPDDQATGGFALSRQYKSYFGDRITATNSYSDGSSKVIFDQYYGVGANDNGNINVSTSRIIAQTVLYSSGLSHVSFGYWEWEGIDHVDTSPASVGGGSLYFVHGDRTPANAIPVSGIASYSATSLRTPSPSVEPGGIDSGIRFELHVDFGARAISTDIEQDYQKVSIASADADYSEIPGLDLHGTGPIRADGAFTVPLDGTLTTSLGDAVRPVAVSGSLDGAFFGPNAEQIGGVFAVGQVPGNSLLSDAFVGARN